ncbi:hypothetical protein SLE2022_270360 [Rubroshorea leprosula]
MVFASGGSFSSINRMFLDALWMEFDIGELGFRSANCAFPQWSDQGTNSKLVQDVWKTGVRVTKNEEGKVESHEIKRCLELVMGSEEMRLSAKKWKDLAREAVMEGGSSDMNLKAFIDDLGKF